MPRLRRYDRFNTARFVTFSCYHRNNLLIKPNVIELFLHTLGEIREQYKMKLFGYVIMPNHVHLVLHPPDDLRLGPVIGHLKARSAGRIVAEQLLTLPESCTIIKDGRERQVVWQPRCYDHNCRSPRTVLEKIEYCHNNPVKARLVSEPGIWRWSSYSWYAGESVVPLASDEIDVES